MFSSLIGNGWCSLVCKRSSVLTSLCHTSRFLCSFSRSLKNKTREASLRCEAQFTGPVFISIILSNPHSEQWISVFGGFHYYFHNVHGMTDWFLHCLLNVRVVSMSPQALSVRSVECKERLWSPFLLLKHAEQVEESVIVRPHVSFKCQSR